MKTRATDRLAELAAKIVKFPNAGSGKPVTMKDLQDSDKKLTGYTSQRFKLRVDNSLKGYQRVHVKKGADWVRVLKKVVLKPGVYSKGAAYISGPVKSKGVRDVPTSVDKADNFMPDGVKHIEDAYFPLMPPDAKDTSTTYIVYVPIKDLVGKAILVGDFAPKKTFPKLTPAQITKVVTQCAAILKRETPKGKYDPDDIGWAESGSDTVYEKLVDVMAKEMGIKDVDADIGTELHNKFHDYFDKKIFLPAVKMSKIDGRWFDIDDFEGASVTAKHRVHSTVTLATCAKLAGEIKKVLGDGYPDLHFLRLDCQMWVCLGVDYKKEPKNLIEHVWSFSGKYGVLITVCNTLQSDGALRVEKVTPETASKTRSIGHLKVHAAKRLLTAGRYVGTQEWFLGLPEEKQKDYLSKKPTSTFKPAHKQVKETKSKTTKGTQTKLRNRAERHLDSRTGLSATISRLKSLTLT